MEIIGNIFLKIGMVALAFVAGWVIFIIGLYLWTLLPKHKVIRRVIICFVFYIIILYVLDFEKSASTFIGAGFYVIIPWFALQLWDKDH